MEFLKKYRWRIGLVFVAAIALAQQPVAQGPQASNAAAWKITGNGTAGSADTGVVTIQGIASGTVVPVSGTITANFAPSAASAQALTIKHVSSAAAFNIKASAGNLYGLVVGNSGTTPCWLQLFNNAGTPTAGTSVIDSYFVQAGVSFPLPPGVFAMENFSTGIAAAGATTDSGATTTGCTTTISVTAFYN